MDIFSSNGNSPIVAAPAGVDADVRTVQWSSGGESRIMDEDRDDIAASVDDCSPGAYKNLFPMHGSFGVLNLQGNGHTLWLFTGGGSYIAGELVHPDTARARSVPASGTVDISALPAEQQAAIMVLLGAKKRK